ANDQRKVIYQQRTEILAATDLGGSIGEMQREATSSLIDQFVTPNSVPQDWNLDGLAEGFQRSFNVSIDPKFWLKAEPELEESKLRSYVHEAAEKSYAQKVERIGAPIMRYVERDVVLKTLDSHWREHLAAMEYLRQGIHLRGYAQKDYRYEFKREAFELFTAMLGRVKFDTVAMLATVEVRTQEQIEREEAERRERLMRALQAQHAEVQPIIGAPPPEVAPGAAPQGAVGAAMRPAPAAVPEGVAPFVRSDRKVGRNEPCPCGSGRKFKHCHGTLAGTQ
ncbi:MAG TPA: SEC-C metal-binding domain-containing protein, partial [Steroidobacteraceae bacterium]|nr:SEC-C metal-binding domain-containing protein [Steroidobacteraceae bacterium]